MSPSAEQQTASHTVPRPPPGLIVPTLAFFTASGEVDLETVGKHAVRLANAGVAALTVHGTTGEHVHLSRSERADIISATRKALDDAGFTADKLPLIIGCGVQSTWESIDLCIEAHKLGGSFALIVPPGYYAGGMTNQVLDEHFRMIADKSPIPVILYNFPGVAGGIDLDYKLILSLAQHPNIVGIKMTDGNVGKATKITAVLKQEEFPVYGGLCDTLLHGLTGGNNAGVVSGLANIAPKACLRVIELFKQGKLDEARKAQAELSLAGEIELGGGIPGLKYGLVHFFGYGGVSRRPLPEANEELKKKVIAWMSPLMDRE